MSGVGVPARPRLKRARTPIPQYREFNFWKSLRLLQKYGLLFWKKLINQFSYRCLQTQIL